MVDYFADLFIKVVNQVLIVFLGRDARLRMGDAADVPAVNDQNGRQQGIHIFFFRFSTVQ